MSRHASLVNRWLPIRLVLFASCAAVVAAGIGYDLPWLRAAALPLAVTALLAPRLAAGRASAWYKLLAAAALVVPVAVWPVFGRLLPALVMTAIGLFFALSLAPGQTPLVERMARAIHASRTELPPGHLVGYRRAWTGIWAIWLLLVAAGIAVVAVAWPTLAGSVLSVIAIPVAIFGLMALEFRIRQHRLAEDESMTFREFLLAVTELRWEHLRS